jgi:hypothetical protein
MRPILSAALSAAVALSAAPTLAQDQTQAAEGPIQVIRAGDAALTCVQIGDEAAQLSERMGGDPGGGVMGSLVGVAKSGAAMLIPGAGLLFAGADAATAERREREAAERQAVENRWFYLNGLHEGRGCRQTAQATPAVGQPAPGGQTTTPPRVTPANAQD